MFNRMFTWMNSNSETIIRCLDVVITGASTGVTAFLLMEAQGQKEEAQMFAISTALTLGVATELGKQLGRFLKKPEIPLPFVNKTAKHLAVLTTKIFTTDLMFQLLKLAQGGYDSAEEFGKDTRAFLQVLVAAYTVVEGLSVLLEDFKSDFKFAPLMLAEAGVVQAVGKMIGIEAATNTFAGAIYAGAAGKIALYSGVKLTAFFKQVAAAESLQPLLASDIEYAPT